MIAILVLSVSYFSIYTYQNILKDNIIKSSETYVSELLDKIDRDIYNKITVSKLISYDIHIHEILLDSNQKFENIENLQEYIFSTDFEWKSAQKVEITPFMKEILGNSVSKDLIKKVKFFENEFGYNVFGEIFITNKFGVNIAQTSKTTDYYQADEEWWVKTKNNGFYISDIEYDSSAEIYSTDIGIRIDDNDGNFIGVLKAVLNFEEVINILRDIELEESHKDHITMTLLLTTEDGRLIYSDKIFNIFEKVSDEILVNFYDNQENLDNDMHHFISKSASHNVLYISRKSNGYKDYRGLGWRIIISYDVDEIFSEVNKLNKIFLLISILILSLIILISFFISRSLFDSIIKLRSAVKKIGEGRLETEIKVDIKDEVGELADDIKKMANDLRISHQKIMQHETELEGKIQERTKELNLKVEDIENTKAATLNMMEDIDEANKELIEAQGKLKEHVEELKTLDTQKDQFISIAAHELKTPLTSIKGFADLLKNEKIAGNQGLRDKYLQIIFKDTKRLGGLITNILELSRMDLGTMRVAWEKVDIQELIDDVKEQMDIIIIGKKLKSEYKVDKYLPKINMDRDKMIQVISNLINNAVHYTNKGKITLGVSRQGEDIIFSVSDTGTGIPKQHQEKIFERFYQVDSPLTRKIGGTGLGLSLCEGFVKAMGGKIWLKSTIGKGTTFYFSVPVKKPKETKEVYELFNKK